MTLLDIIRKKKLATATVATPATDNPVLVPSVATVAGVAVAKQKSGKVIFPEKPAPVKAVTPEDAKLKKRREKVLAMLAENPDSQRAIITDLDCDPDNVILTIAIRNQYTFEMLIPKHRYDGFLLLEIIEKGSVQ